jgi:ATP-dependent Clp protease ATP-binding subunit ClpA
MLWLLSTCFHYLVKVQALFSRPATHLWLVLFALQDQKIDSASGDANFEALAKYGTDLTANAARLDPVIGRDDEIRRVVRILSR